MLLCAISITMVIVGTGNNLALADPCTATLSYPVIPVVYSNANVPIVVPISASCTTYYSNQLYATGNAYDATANVGLGTASTLLTSVNGGTEFNGQIGFNLPPTAQGHSVQISVSIYSSQYGDLITATSETVEIGPAVQQTTTTTVTAAPYYSYAYPYPTAYPAPYQGNESQYYFEPQSQGHHNFETHFQPETRSDTNLLDYVAIIAILAAVIIATVGLVLAGRRHTYSYWVPPPMLPQ